MSSAGIKCLEILSSSCNQSLYSTQRQWENKQLQENLRVGLGFFVCLVGLCFLPFSMKKFLLYFAQLESQLSLQTYSSFSQTYPSNPNQKIQQSCSNKKGKLPVQDHKVNSTASGMFPGICYSYTSWHCRYEFPSPFVSINTIALLLTFRGELYSPYCK